MHASSAWDPYVGKQVNKLEAVQNKAARFVTNQHHWETSVTKLKDTLGWRSLQERRFIARMTLWYKAIHAQAAVSIPSYYAPKPVDPYDTEIRASHDQQYSSPHRHNRPMEIFILPAERQSLEHSPTPSCDKTDRSRQ